MATYSTEIEAAKGQDEVFEYMATFANALEWDPGVVEGESLTPGPARVGSVYRLGVRIAGRVVPFDYRVLELDRPRRVVLQATHGHMVSTDTITVEQNGSGSRGPVPRRARGARPAPGGVAPPRPVLRHHGGQRGRRAPHHVGMTRSRLSAVVDGVLEATVAGSFSRTGYAVRSRLEHWSPPADLTGRVVVVTGASSGIGQAAALELARLGATLWLVGRDKGRIEATARQARDLGRGAVVEPVELDLVDADALRAFAARVAARHDRLHALVHAAGALFPTYRRAPSGGELTVATAVVAPFELTWWLSPLLRRAGDATIVTVSSGGMYSQPFDLERLEMTPEDYRGHHRVRAGEAGPGRAVPRVGPTLGRRRCGQLRVAPGLGGHARTGQRAAHLRQARAIAPDARRRRRHGGLARGRRGQGSGSGPADDRGVLPRSAPARRVPPALDGPRRGSCGRAPAVGVVRGPRRPPGRAPHSIRTNRLSGRGDARPSDPDGQRPRGQCALLHRDHGFHRRR